MPISGVATYGHTRAFARVKVCCYNIVYWEIFASLNFREFRVSFPIRENLFQEILGGVAHY